MINQILVSVIVPTYKQDELFKRALISLLAQTHNNIEIIVVDDNADSLWNLKIANIIAELQILSNIEIILVTNKINKGSAKSRNVGVEFSRGEYLTFLDDDDVYLDGKIENQLVSMVNENADYSITDLILYNMNDDIIQRRNRTFIKSNNNSDLLKYHLLHHLTGTNVLMFRKSFFTDIGMFPPIDLGDEFYLVLNAILSKGRFLYIPICDVKAYVADSASGISSGEGKVIGEKKLYETKKKYFYLLNLSERNSIKMRHFAVLSFAYFRMNKYSKAVFHLFRSFCYNPKAFFMMIKYNR